MTPYGKQRGDRAIITSFALCPVLHLVHKQRNAYILSQKSENHIFRAKALYVSTMMSG